MKHANVLIITQTKFDDTFSTIQSLMKIFIEPFKLDRNGNEVKRSAILLYGVSGKLLIKHIFLADIKGLCKELTFRKF